MIDPFYLVGADSARPALAVACLNLFVALARVSVSPLLGLAFSMAARACERAREAQPVRLKFERRAAK
jgi:hypothetical protein